MRWDARRPLPVGDDRRLEMTGAISPAALRVTFCETRGGGLPFRLPHRLNRRQAVEAPDAIPPPVFGVLKPAIISPPRQRAGVNLQRYGGLRQGQPSLIG